MSEKHEQLDHAPIVEVVLDIDCDMLPTVDIEELKERARELLGESYPTFRKKLMSEHIIEMKSDAPSEMSSRRETQAIMFLHEDEKQLVQVRRQGYSFNRLSPYSSLDDYIPEIQRTWELFLEIASCGQVRSIRLRYINRLPIPFMGEINLDDYLETGPHLADEESLMFTGFLHQHTAVEKESNNEAKIILASQQREEDTLPIIFDITVSRTEAVETDQWNSILSIIQSLRQLKNDIFFGSLTEKCLDLFR